MNKKPVFFEDMGIKKYEETWNYQKKLFDRMKKKSHIQKKFVGYLLFVEYSNHTYTIGKNGNQEKNLLVTLDFLKQINASIYQIDRGGDITYHGPGQLVVYPILDMNYFFLDIHKYLRFLEEVIIYFLWKNYKIHGIRKKNQTGVWLLPPTNHLEKSKKICSIGIKISRWITMHGFALNINTNLKYFDYIIPCGLYKKKMTSLKEVLNQNVSFEKVKDLIKESFEKIFGMDLILIKKTIPILLMIDWFYNHNSIFMVHFS